MKTYCLIILALLIIVLSGCNIQDTPKKILPPSEDESKPLLIETPKTSDQGCYRSCGGFSCEPENPTCLLIWTVDMLCSKYVECNDTGTTCQTIRSSEYYTCIDCFGAFNGVTPPSGVCVPTSCQNDLPEEYAYVKEKHPKLLC